MSFNETATAPDKALIAKVLMPAIWLGMAELLRSRSAPINNPMPMAKPRFSMLAMAGIMVYIEKNLLKIQNAQSGLWICPDEATQHTLAS
jgi:hypothetical protein